jgi:hypothetical protein
VPPKLAVTEYVPAANTVESDAEPLTRDAVPSTVGPFANVTVPPVGRFALGGLVTTVAVRTSDWPKVRLLADAETEIKVGVVNNCRSSSGTTIEARQLRRRSLARELRKERRDPQANHFGESRNDMVRILL